MIWSLLFTSPKVVSAQSGATRRDAVRVLKRPPRRVAFDWATRRKPLAGRTLWMLEPTLVLTGEWADTKEKAARGRMRIGERSAVWLRCAPNHSSMPVFAA